MAYDSSDKPGSNELDRNPDPITGAPGSHPLGTGIGAGSGALTGAAIGMIGGPVGAAIGIIAGGIVGAITGHAAGEANDPTEDRSATGQTHADPVASVTNPAEGAASDRLTRGTTATASAAAGSTGSTSGSRYATLDAADAEYYRGSYGKAPYANDLADADFEADLTPAYGYGHEVSRQAATTGQTKAFTELEPDLRAGWDHVKGQSKLTYDQARPAIEEAYGRSLKLHEERLSVSKDRVQTGDVSIRKEIITENKQIEVPVEREEVVITTRALNEAGGSIDETQTLRVPVSEERVHVEKQVVATGEVTLDKKVIQDTKTVVDSLRKEKVKIDRTGDVKVNEETGSTT